MEQALTIADIEDRVRDRLAHKAVDAIILAFAPYNGDPNSLVAGYLRRWSDYNYHSGEYVDVFNVGYARYGDNRPHDQKYEVTELFNGVQGYFYPSLFNEIRRFVSSQTKRAWNYAGGIDFLLFPVRPEMPNAPVGWSQAVALKSSDLIPNLFRDVDELTRSVLNLAEARNGRFETDDFNGEISQRRIKRGLGIFVKVFGPKIIDVATKIFVPAGH